ncbi:hypothetical protein QFZ88_005886 [Mesorhizobium sp. YL-MeA3-2017]|jgi:hypothetical protein|uniref:DUF6522 family protein n=1 Tax=Mesorhizobium sp. YL-MeA3-2017 TaxID=3042284 RepID=UPI0015CD7AA7|nr:DUF6522 family protein [Mesorhizobium sp. YL-MeA3-2017]MDQ0333504.1 hypothetical protein [Mesorhizobium sp. YL-MeA3-2017]
MRVEITNGDIVIDAQLLSQLLNVSAADLPDLMHSQAITSLCERGIDDHEGQYRLSFFYLNRRLRLAVNRTGQVVQHTTVDFGTRPLPRKLRRPGD